MSNNRKQQIENTEKASVTNVIFPLILIMLFFFAFAKSAKSQVAYVNYAAVGANDGTTWVNAYPSLQTAIENAASGSQIWVARGTYKPNVYPIGTTDGSSERDYSFTLRNNVAIYGGFVGTETILSARNIANNPAILSGDIGIAGDNSDNCYHVVLGDYINSSSILDGFIIRDGNANTNSITTHTPSGHILPSHSGGGMFLNFASPNISNCIITNNDAIYAGGGVVAQGTSNETFFNCVFTNNRVLTATFGGAGLYNYAHPSNPSFPIVTNCVFTNNSSLGAGGAIYTQYSNMTITNSTIYNNTAQLWGGGIYNEDSSNMVVKNCIIWGNIGNAVTHPAGSDAGLTWNVIEPVVSFSLLQTPSTYSSNISTNPLFVNSSNAIGTDGKWTTTDDGLRLSPCSPAIDAGTTTLAPIVDIANATRPQGAGVDMGAYEYTPTGMSVATRLYVDAAASAGGIGTSWATAYNSLETALTNARVSTCVSEIWVKQGTYYPTQQYNVLSGDVTTGNARLQTFKMPNGVAVYGGFVGTETSVAARPVPLVNTVLSGDLGMDHSYANNSYHVVSFYHTNSSTILDGFTITAGSADGGPTSFGGLGASELGSGAGVYNNGSGAGNSSNPTISNCTFYLMDAILGGGVFNNASPGGTCNPSFTNCNFTNLKAYNGGAFFNRGTSGTCNPNFTNCTFNQNEGLASNSGIYNDGTSGVCSPTYKNCILWNTPTNNISSTPTYTYCDVQGGAAGVGNINTDPIFVNASISGVAGSDFQFANNDDGLILQSTSPCINTGTNTGAPSRDIRGNARPSGGTVDMGAYEYSVATLTITASAGVGGLISPNGATTVLYSSNKTYTITANTGYCIQDVLVDGVSVGAVASYTFTGIISSHTIAASFVARTTASVSIIAARNNVCYGATTYIIATPTNGGTAPMYNFYVDGVAQGNSAVARFNTSLLSVGLHAVYCVMTSNNICQTSNIANSNAININVGNITVLPSIGGATSACVLGIGSRLFNTVGGGVWSSSNLGVATINNSTGIATGVSAGVSVITYTYTNSFGCVNTANTNFNVAPIGNVEQITGATGLCVGSTITLSNATTGGVWSSIAGRAIINASGIVTATSAGVAQIRYTVSNAFGCNAYVGRNITVNAIPAQPRIAYAVGTVNPQTGAGGAFCNGRTFTLVGTPSGGVWSTSNPVVITINNSTGVANTIGVGIGSITYTYTLSGCSNARAITGTVANCPSPRGNNNNDRLPIDVYQNSFDLYPNPANSVVSLNVNQLIGNGSIVVTDLYGKQIKIQPLSMGKNDIAVSKFSKGFYFVSVIANGNMQTHKLIVE